MPDFSLSILEWYRQNKRDLPWRRTKDPYKIWLSEIILQQTRVDQGLEYYEKFVRNYPTVHSLANASEQDVLNDWQGLGYYSRARNLHASAKLITEHLQGIFPGNYQELLQLKGVGPYTAAAIASISFDEPYAVVDGNVYRVLSRYFGISSPIDSSKGIKEFQTLAQEILISDHPGEFNQAMMEFGARQCKPASPNCDVCPVSLNCAALEKNLVSKLPYKSGKQKVRNRYFLFTAHTKSGKIAIQKRTSNDVWKHLYQLPLLEFESEKELLKHVDVSDKEPVMIKHQLSHQKIHAYFIQATIHIESPSINWVSYNDLDKYPFPVLITRYFESYLFDT